jgi:hypothetical protein
MSASRSAATMRTLDHEHHRVLLALGLRRHRLLRRRESGRTPRRGGELMAAPMEKTRHARHLQAGRVSALLLYRELVLSTELDRYSRAGVEARRGNRGSPAIAAVPLGCQPMGLTRGAMTFAHLRPRGRLPTFVTPGVPGSLLTRDLLRPSRRRESIRRSSAWIRSGALLAWRDSLCRIGGLDSSR